MYKRIFMLKRSKLGKKEKIEKVIIVSEEKNVVK